MEKKNDSDDDITSVNKSELSKYSGVISDAFVDEFEGSAIMDNNFTRRNSNLDVPNFSINEGG